MAEFYRDPDTGKTASKLQPCSVEEARKALGLDSNGGVGKPEPAPVRVCPLPCYWCNCKGSWCRLLGRNLDA